MVVCGDVWWFWFFSGGLWRFVVVCGDLRQFVVVCLLVIPTAGECRFCLVPSSTRYQTEQDYTQHCQWGTPVNSVPLTSTSTVAVTS